MRLMHRKSLNVKNKKKNKFCCLFSVVQTSKLCKWFIKTITTVQLSMTHGFSDKVIPKEVFLSRDFLMYADIRKIWGQRWLEKHFYSKRVLQLTYYKFQVIGPFVGNTATVYIQQVFRSTCHTYEIFSPPLWI